MFGKILGAIFNRWTLLALLLLALLAVVWIIGPLVAVGAWRPLDSVTARWVFTGVLLALAAVIVIWSALAAKLGNRKVVDKLAAAPPAAAAESADLVAVRQRFADALATLRNARFGSDSGGRFLRGLRNKLGGRYLYQLPWYLIIGAPGSGKTTALQNSGLQFPLAATHGDKAVRGVGGTRLCDWWFTDRAVLIDTAGRFTTQDSDAVADKATWGGFLELLKSSRPRQPLNGVLVTVSVGDLLGRSAFERAEHAQAVRARVQELHEQLRIRFPIYLLVTKCDLLAGFADMFGTLDKDQRATPWGFTFPLAAAGGARAAAERMGPEFAALLERLDQGLIDRLQAEADPQRRARIYGFPNQFANLEPLLAEFAQQVFAPSPFEADPLLRGVYFVSGTQEGTPIDRVLGSVARRYRLEQALLPAQRSSGRSFFLQRLLTDVVFAEHNLSGTDRRWERRRDALAIAGYAGIGVLSLAALGAWFVSWRNNVAYVEQVAARAQTVRQQVQATPNRASPDLVPILPALDDVRGLAQEGGKVDDRVPWSLGFGLYQGKKLDSAARDAYQRMLQDAVLPRLALRVEQQLRTPDQPELHYEALKSYLMLYEPSHFDAAALSAYFEADWDAGLAREITPEQRAAMSRHLDALLERGAVVSPLPQDKALVDATRNLLATTSLAQRVYRRLRVRGLRSDFPEVSVVSAGGPTAQNVFVRASGLPLTKGVPGLFTYDGYHKGFQPEVEKATRTLADEQTWVLGIAPAPAAAADAIGAGARMVDDVRRLYLNDYRDEWKRFIADIKLQPSSSMTQIIERTRFLSGPDSPLLPMLRTFSRNTTLLAAPTGKVAQVGGKVEEAIRGGQQAVREALGAKPQTTGAPGARIESIVDDEFRDLRALVSAPEGGKAPIEGVIARLAELQVYLISVDNALKSKVQPPASTLPAEMEAQAGNTPEPVNTMLNTLGQASKRVGNLVIRQTLSDLVKTKIGDFCQQATSGRYPFDSSSRSDVTPADFTALFGPGGRFEQVQATLGPYIDTTTKPWRFRAVDGVPIGSDLGTLPQFQRAQAIRDAFFASGASVPGLRMTVKPVEMDTRLREFILDVDGQIVRYDHGPQIPIEVKWPGPRGSNIVGVTVQPAGITGISVDGPWALFRVFDRVNLQPGAAPEKFRAVFDLDGRKATFDITMASVRNPLRLPELRQFQCPMGL